MSISRIKNIVIVVLLLVDVVFLALIVSDRMDSIKENNKTKERLVKVMADNGITLKKSDIPDDVELTEYIIGRDMQQEQDIAKAVIGDCRREDQGGNIFVYVSDLGTASFRASGEFEITLNENSNIEYSKIKAESLLKDMGIKVGEVQKYEDDSNIMLVFPCKLNEKQIFGCNVQLKYENGYLISVSGKMPTSEPEYRTSNQFLTVATALMKFIQNMSADGHVCSSINFIESGYMMFVSVSGERSLTPVWHISTDSGSYYVNGISGAAV